MYRVLITDTFPGFWFRRTETGDGEFEKNVCGLWNL